MAKHCPYCDARATRTDGWYFECENDHTFHLDDWTVEQLQEGTTVDV